MKNLRHYLSLKQVIKTLKEFISVSYIRILYIYIKFRWRTFVIRYGYQTKSQESYDEKFITVVLSEEMIINVFCEICTCSNQFQE